MKIWLTGVVVVAAVLLCPVCAGAASEDVVNDPITGFHLVLPAWLEEAELAEEGAIFSQDRNERRESLDSVGLRWGVRDMKDADSLGFFFEPYLNLFVTESWFIPVRAGMVSVDDDDERLRGTYVSWGLGYDIFMVESYKNRFSVRPQAAFVYQFNDLEVTASGKTDAFVQAGITDLTATMDDSLGASVGFEFVFSWLMVPEASDGNPLEGSLQVLYTWMRSDVEAFGSALGLVGAFTDDEVNLDGFSVGLSVGYRF